MTNQQMLFLSLSSSDFIEFTHTSCLI